MIARVSAVVVVSAGLLAQAGCGPARLDVTQTAEVAPGTPKMLDLDAQPQPQTITVEYESSASPVEIGLYPANDADAAEMLEPDKALKYEKGKSSGSISHEVPANTAVKVSVGSLKSRTSVKLHITNKK